MKDACRDRAAAALLGLAIGDALGMPTQLLPRSAIVARYGGLLGGFEQGPKDHPIAAGVAAGRVTDDTEQALLLADLLVASGGAIDPAELARRLADWEDRMRRRGSLDLLGPSTRAALADLSAGVDVETSGRRGVTNGAAMRITPVGITNPAGDLPALVEQVVLASKATHNTGVALAGAAAVAAAVSAGIDGARTATATATAVEAAGLATHRGHWVAGADVATRIAWAARLGADAGAGGVTDTVYRLVGTSLATQESVPAAFAVLAAHPDDPWMACRVAASLGGDCDTIAAMVGAVAGACSGLAAFPPSARYTVETVNSLDPVGIAEALMVLRERASRR